MDMNQCCACGSEADEEAYFAHGSEYLGILPGEYLCSVHNSGAFPCGELILLIRERRAALAQPAEVKVYGTQPEELPKTLPAGTKFKNEYYEGVFKSDGVLGTYYYRGEGTYRHLAVPGELVPDRLMVNADWIDWSTVPIQPAPARSGSVETATREDAARGAGNDAQADSSTQPPEPERFCAACNVKIASTAERCVYCEKRRDDHLSGRESNVKPSDLHERIAAARASIEAAKQRNSVEHPDAFPEDAFLDAPSCDP